MSIKRYTNRFLIPLLALLASCSNTKHLPAGETLFNGAKVHIDDKVVSKTEKNILINDLEGVIRPRPNSKIFGIPYKLAIYNAAGTPKKKKGLRNWLRNKVGEPPVLTSSIHIAANKDLMINVLQNRGYFYSIVSSKMVTDKKRKTTAVFDVTTGLQYTINKTAFISDSSVISRDIDSNFANSTLLKSGQPYNLDLIKGERTRIDMLLKEKGFYFFKPDYMIVLVDTTIGGMKANMYVKLKKNVPDQVYNAYIINNIYIYPNYKLRGNGEDTSKAKAVVVDGYSIVDVHKTFKTDIFVRSMEFEKGDLYSLGDQNISLSRLVNLGTFKFVKNRFDPVGDSMLDVYYYLTQFPRKSLSFQLGGLTQNDDRAGLEGDVSWRNRNAFKGGEELLFKVDGGFEAQYSGIEKEPNIYNLSAETDLSFPKFEVPFIDINSSSQYVPRSIVKLNYTYESESDLLRINSYTVSYGFDWKEGPHKEHQFYPFNFTYVKTDTLGHADSLDQLYGNLIFDGIILGPTYEFTYNTQGTKTQRKNDFYFDGLIDLSGNILGLAEHADYNTNPQTIFGSRYAQYAKLQPDFRYYLHFNPNTTFAARIMAGIGIPYGNSDELPNIKQFWAGGNSDLRGFPSRLVGPGTYNEYYTTEHDANAPTYIETLGDMKLELNAELRQHVYKFINLGVFSDAGNIWTYHANPAFPGGQFTSDFYKQLATDVGFGLRFDFKILLVRLDLGMPVFEPWLPDGQQWVLNKIAFGDPSWRKDNLVFNIAIGYPF
jgi:outer membrane protein insertion porin family